jgi:hypothetical protein
MAPKSGKEFREELSEESEKFIDKAKKDLELAAKAAAHSYEKGRDKFMEKIIEDSDTKVAATESTKQTKSSAKKTAAKKPSKTAKKTSNKN